MNQIELLIGVGYVINKNIGNCSYYTLNPESIESFEMNFISSNFGTFLELKNPNELFGLDDRAFYAGQRYERGMLCDVYVVNKTDLKFPDVKADYFVLEVYILSVRFFFINNNQLISNYIIK